jgi:hypothetical protein
MCDSTAISAATLVCYRLPHPINDTITCFSIFLSYDKNAWSSIIVTADSAVCKAALWWTESEIFQDTRTFRNCISFWFSELDYCSVQSAGACQHQQWGKFVKKRGNYVRAVTPVMVMIQAGIEGWPTAPCSLQHWDRHGSVQLLLMQSNVTFYWIM